MNQLAERTERLPMESVGISATGAGAKIAPQNLGEVVKFAEVMCRADIALPKHLRGNAGACMAVSLQALDWQMNPFAVASKSYSVNGTIAYEAQLIVAVVNTRSGIEGRITYEFEGEGADRVCIASGKLDGEVLSVRSPKFKDITPKNSPLWKSDPDQQQCYYTGRSWARRYTPEVILGVYDRDEAESFTGPDNAKDITPQPSVIQRLRQGATQEPTSEREGFDESFVQSETSAALSGEIITDTDTGSLPSSEPEADALSPEQSAEAGDPPMSSASPIDPDRDTLIRYARDILPMAAQSGISLDALKAIDKEWAAQIGKMTVAGVEKARQINNSSRTIFNDPEKLDGVVEHYAEMLDCSVDDLRG